MNETHGTHGTHGSTAVKVRRFRPTDAPAVWASAGR